MAALFGTGVACLGLGVWAFFAWDGPSAAVVLAGCALYLVGTIGVTIAANVPLNDRLAKLDPRDADAGVFWGRFVWRWSAWNHVRTVAALAAAALLTVTLPV